ncbi:hemerythrin domain-containing protein [Methanoculleus oceani]|uniref:Hemerythrin n=1 Tax=Methanoculleus oceani TaxID=2184756 RepID=A0ABD4TDW4_9EURY|nr:hemerythrin domain-containing protein [Methanoculleus sp. CWC-02]MCM2466330.1 hemerythrin [Methanoculleus sp. CWC-02]
MPQILEFIRDDHDLIRGLFDELESNPETRDVRCITLRRELPGHIYAEEATFYARLRDVVPEEIRQSLREHTDIRETLARFEMIPLRDDTWMPALVGLRELVETHFTLEEREVFSRAEHHLSPAELFGLGEMFEQEKQKAAQFAAI